MAHELELNENGEARMFYAGEKPWHGLGTEVEQELTSAAAIRLAGLDWTVEKRHLYFQAGDAVEEVTDKKGIVRLEDEKILGIVNNSYACIQNSEAFEFLDSLVGEGLAMYHTAGSLFGGRRVFMCCKLPDTFSIGPDKIEKYLVAMTAHDGTSAFHIKWTPIRVVCNNTLSAAFEINAKGRVKADADMVSICHTKNYRGKIDYARELLSLSDGYYKRIEDCFNRLIQTPMVESEYILFTETLLPACYETENGEISKKGETMWKKRQEELLDTYHTGIGLNSPEIAGTRWAAYNAICEYADHRKKFNPIKNDTEEVRMNSIIWGWSALMKKQALVLLNQ